MRWTSKKAGVVLRAAAMMGGPKEMLGTKWPSMTSRWRKSAPPVRTSFISAPSLAKSAERMEGRIWWVEVEKGLVVMGNQVKREDMKHEEGCRIGSSCFHVSCLYSWSVGSARCARGSARSVEDV